MSIVEHQHRAAVKPTGDVPAAMTFSWRLASGAITDPSGAARSLRLVVHVEHGRVSAEVCPRTGGEHLNGDVESTLARATESHAPTWNIREGCVHVTCKSIDASVRIDADGSASVLYARTSLLTLLGVAGGRFGRPQVSIG